MRHTQPLCLASQVLAIGKASASSRNAISILVSPGPREVLGGTFILQKPVPLDLAARTLRVAKATMFNEFRRYYRHPLNLAVAITKDSGGELHATTTNISCRGFAIGTAFDALASEHVVHTRLTLTEGNCVELKAKLMWSDPGGETGFQFDGGLPRDRQRLEEWLGARLPLK